MTDTRECPLCGGSMQLKRTQVVVRVPGDPTPTSQASTEWICPDCDYFEDAEDEKA